MSALDQDDGVANLLSIDFAKAFNTMSHQACLAALSDKEASPHCIRMTAAFLSDRRMVFKAGTTLSEARHLKGGAPQGTLLGNYLFIAATDSLGKREKRASEEAVTRTQSALTHLQIERGTRFFNDDSTYESTPIKRRGILPVINEANFSTPTARG